MSTISATTARERRRATRPWSRIACVAAAAGTAIPFALCGLTGDTGAEINAGLVDDRGPLIAGTYAAMLVAAGLFVATSRLSRAVSGVASSLIVVAGSAVALLYAGYYSAFGAGAVLVDPQTSGAGLGESAWLVLNVMELTRYAPGLALMAAAIAAGPALPRWTRIGAAFLAALTLVPFTSWVAALLIPVWLGVSAAVVREHR